MKEIKLDLTTKIYTSDIRTPYWKTSLSFYASEVLKYNSISKLDGEIKFILFHLFIITY